GGVQGFYRHASETIGLPMRVGVYRPPQAFVSEPAALPVLIFLAGLTCNEETFAIKAGAQRVAAELGLVLVTPDTSPRDTGVDGADASWDFGTGAGFYLDATVAPWARHWRMESYITQELPAWLAANFGVDTARCGIFGHSMGGHGALVLALRHSGLFQSVSAFAPVVAPTQCPWGQKAFGNYLGPDLDSWQQYDASALMATRTTPYPQGILIDQGLNDQFLSGQLLPHVFEAACVTADQPLTLRRHPGYDHSYYFISTFMEDHLAFHSRNLHS
ncbi:MAG: S-formylglutathione hydrolase, partial [bacterium]